MQRNYSILHHSFGFAMMIFTIPLNINLNVVAAVLNINAECKNVPLGFSWDWLDWTELGSLWSESCIGPLGLGWLSSIVSIYFLVVIVQNNRDDY